MNRNIFTSDKPGELRKFAHSQSERESWLFIPHALPPAWEFPVRLWPLLADAKEALGTLNGIGQTLRNPDLLLRPLQGREAISSSSIEGTYVTPQQLLLYELDPQEPDSADEAIADRNEVANYRAALTLGCRLIEQGPILNRHLLEMHKTLMRGVRGARKSPGEFRRVQVQIGATGKYVPPPPLEVPRLMGNLERAVNEPGDLIDPLVQCYIAHYQIEAIHPFVDGNGRIGRVLLALMTYKFLGHSMPWLYMSPFFEQHRKEYTDNLLRVSTHGDWESWIEFCLVGTITQARDAIRRCEAMRSLRDQYHERIESRPTPRSHSIIEGLFESPILNVPATAKKFAVTYKTAQADLQRQTEVGILSEVAGSRPRSFYAFELLSVAYDDAWDEPAASASQK